MDEAISKAAALVEAHGYIRQFAGTTVVVKVGGSIMDQPESLGNLIGDICFLKAVGMKPIIVHGGGKSITAAMQKAGLEAQFVQGRRYTDQRTLSIAEHVLVNDVNKGIIEHIREQGYKAMGVHSLASCAVFAQRMFLQVQEDGDDAPRKVDIGFVGDVNWVNGELLNALTDSGVIPVIAPIARDQAGGKLNVNADSVAGHVAAAVKSEKLILVSDTHGIRTGESEDTLVSHLTKPQIEQLITDGVISSGMLPKVEASFTALQGGVRKVHIVDGRIPHSLLLEIYTNTGIGTEIVL
ncbi:MAG TPA: acetylglutamate kinase [Phycisphaerales bacterium]|nr:acetylglutamate kinase [Phycisphaerales bacterium]|tara:strand:- start:147703 stop:148590 length:888 start_codon:yes stop_codon:yes gene_type:complete